MRKPGIPFTFLLFFFLMTCGTDSLPSEDEGQVVEDSTVETSSDLKPDCQPEAKILEGNSLLIRERGLGVFIGSDSSTYAPDIGDSHRLLITMDMKKCEEVDRQILPMNLAPDFPYYLADLSYHRLREVIAIKGLKTVLCYDLDKKVIFGPIEPAYKNEREYADAQSGNIQRLEVWEDYLIGYATDLGPFAFMIGADHSLKPYLPVVEYTVNAPDYASLFLIPTINSRVQAIIPGMEDQPPYGFSIETLFDQALELRGDLVKISAQYVIVGQTPDGEQVLIDLKGKKRVGLPDNLKQATVKQVAEWVKGNT